VGADHQSAGPAPVGLAAIGFKQGFLHPKSGCGVVEATVPQSFVDFETALEASIMFAAGLLQYRPGVFSDVDALIIFGTEELFLKKTGSAGTVLVVSVRRCQLRQQR
jgi:hypothetical protein